MNIQFKAKSVAEIEAVFAYYRSLGYRIADFSPQQYLEKYPHIRIRDNKSIGGNTHFDESKGKLVEFKDIFVIPPKVKTVVLNSEYTAEVTEDGIKVGCQTFPLDIVDRLVEARDKIIK